MELAHQMAMGNPSIQAEMIEANEFYEIALRYNVNGVPQINFNNGAGVIIKAVPEEYLLQELTRSVEN